MRMPIRLSLIAGLSIAGIGAAAADSDVSVWRWHVTNVLRAQQNRVVQPSPLCERRASAIEPSSRFLDCSQRYFGDPPWAISHAARENLTVGSLKGFPTAVGLAPGQGGASWAVGR
jgi:hypothetical protein